LRKTDQISESPKNWNSVSDGWQRIYIDFTPDSKVALSPFHTAGFSRSALLAWSIVVSTGAIHDISRDNRRKA